MVIRKKYKFEAAHKVRNCASSRCSQNIHGHSFIVEVLLHAGVLDNGGMVVDFGLLKDTIGEFMDWFDHSLIVWGEDKETLAIAHKANQRVCILPFNTTAENLSKLMFMAISSIFENTIFTNGEIGVSVESVRVHETATGYAECFYAEISSEDWKALPKLYFKHIHSSHEIMKLIFGEIKKTNPMVIK